MRSSGVGRSSGAGQLPTVCAAQVHAAATAPAARLPLTGARVALFGLVDCLSAITSPPAPSNAEQTLQRVPGSSLSVGSGRSPARSAHPPQRLQSHAHAYALQPAHRQTTPQARRLASSDGRETAWPLRGRREKRGKNGVPWCASSGRAAAAEPRPPCACAPLPLSPERVARGWCVWRPRAFRGTHQLDSRRHEESSDAAGARGERRCRASRGASGALRIDPTHLVRNQPIHNPRILDIFLVCF